MKKTSVVLTLIFLSGVAVLGLRLSKDELVSWYISQKTGVPVEIHRAAMPRWGQLVFSDLRLGETKEAQALFDHVSLLIRRKKGLWSVRVLEARSRDLHVGGGAWMATDGLNKLDLRLVVSPALFSRWPENVTRKMATDKEGWRSIIVAFGKDTWTLRGSRGPLLQFKGRVDILGLMKIL